VFTCKRQAAEATTNQLDDTGSGVKNIFYATTFIASLISSCFRCLTFDACMCMHLYFWDLAILGNSIIFVLSYILCNAGMKDEGEECNSAGINNFISGARHYSSQKERRFLFLRDLLDRKDDSCTIAHDFLRVPPFSSRPHASLTSSPRPLIPVEVLRRSRFPSFFFLFFFCSTNSILAAIVCADALSIFPDFCRHRVAFAYRFRCTDTPESIRSPPFNITRLPRRFCSSRPDESLHVIRITDEERVVVSISSAQLYVLRPEVENYHRNTKTATVV